MHRSDLEQYYHIYEQEGLKPALLQTPLNPLGLNIMGVKPTAELIVLQNKLYINGKYKGHALELFDYLNIKSSKSFFPAWIGFIAYEFAQNFGLATKKEFTGLPQAAFYYYEQGFLFKGHRQIESIPVLKNNKYLFDKDIRTIKIEKNFDKENFILGADKVKKYIVDGDIYQLNLSSQFISKINSDPIAIYSQLKKINPSPFMGLMQNNTEWSIICNSPERLFNCKGNMISSRPIAGTRPRGKDPIEDENLQNDLLSDAKERAEHIMLVDLMRNDLSQVCMPGTVEVSELFTIEKYSHVMHLVSEVKGQLNGNLQQCFKAIFPGGTITGAPKKRTMEIISELEQQPRGAYTGSMGYVSGCGVDFNILIRTLFSVDNKYFFSAGAGIVIDSNSKKECTESINKSKAFLSLSQKESINITYCAPIKNKKWPSPKGVKKCYGKVLFIECMDSFSYNIVNYLKILGVDVDVKLYNEEIDLHSYDSVIIGPGPGNPQNMNLLLLLVKKIIEANKPLLGICLGHQAIGAFYGAEIVKAKAAIHGKESSLKLYESPLFKNISSKTKFARYNSLLIDKIPFKIKCIAESLDGEVMAISHIDKAIFGIQFHPESIISENGIVILQNFLNMAKPCKIS